MSMKWTLVFLCLTGWPVTLGKPDWEDLFLSQETEQVGSLLRNGQTCSCGSTNRGRIVGGSETGRNEYPFIVSLQSRGRHFCGGSILTTQHILTAAHCTSDLTAAQIQVNAGAHNLDQRSEGIFRVQRIINHRNYNEEEVVNDISMLVLATPLRFGTNVSPICLPTQSLNIVGQSIRALGWGNTVNGGRPARTLQEVDLRVVSYNQCYNTWRRTGNPVLPVSSQNLCTFEFRRDTCQGDSGGPLVWQDPATNRWVQVALVSYGGACAGPLPGVNTDVAHYRDWINAQIVGTNMGVSACGSNGRSTTGGGGGGATTGGSGGGGGAASGGGRPVTAGSGGGSSGGSGIGSLFPSGGSNFPSGGSLFPFFPSSIFFPNRVILSSV